MFCLAVAVTPHKSLNSSTGVVKNWELVRTDPDEIKENVPKIKGEKYNKAKAAG